MRTLQIIMMAALLTMGAAQVRAGDAEPVTEANVAQRVTAAKSAADHEALAAYFRTQAAAAEQKAKNHEAMLASFQKAEGKTSQVWDTHCKSLIRSFRSAAKDYQSLAQEQDTLAKKAGPQP